MKVSININEDLYVKLTDYGIDIYAKYTMEYSNKSLNEVKQEIINERLFDGYHKFQIYDFMNIFGGSFRLGGGIQPCDINVIFDIKFTRQNKIEKLLEDN